MPQIELMLSDLPHTLYNMDKKAKKAGDDEAERLQLEANRRAEERRRQQTEGYTIEEVFEGVAD